MAEQKSHQCTNKRHVHDKVSFDVVKAKLADLTTHIDRSDEFTSPVLATLLRLLIDYSCHECHKNSLKAILDVASKFKPNLLCIKFVAQAVINVQLNQDLLDWGIVQVIIGIIKDFLQIEPDENKKDKLVTDVKLLPMARTLLSRYFANEGQADRNKSLTEDVLDLFLIVFGAAHMWNRNPDKQLNDALVQSFSFDPSKVYSIVSLAVQSMSVGQGRYKFWDDFVEDVHFFHRIKWLTDKEFANEYLKILMNYEGVLKGQDSSNPCYRNNGAWQRRRNVTSVMVEVLRGARIMPSREMIVFVTKLQQGNEMTVEWMKLFAENIGRITKQQSVKLHHDVYEFETESTKRFADQLIVEVNQSASMSFLDEFMETIVEKIYSSVRFDVYFVIGLIRLSNYDHVNNKKLYRTLILKCIDENTDNCARKVRLLEHGIARTVWDVINNLHEKCLLCQDVIELMHMFLKSVTPELFEIIHELNLNRTTQLAAAVPYVVREKENLMRAMYVDGFELLARQLAKGEDIKSLHMIAQACQTQPPEPWLTVVSCTTDQRVGRAKKGTKVVVLDDGTKIRVNTSHLAENSEYFAKLFDEKASLEEISLHEVTAFQFRFLVQFAALSTPEPNIVIDFDLDAQQHVDLIILCDKLMLPTLRELLVDSLRWCHLKTETCPDVYNVGASHNLQSLRRACVHFALFGDGKDRPRIESLRHLFQNVDKKLLARDVERWFYDECANYPTLDFELHNFLKYRGIHRFVALTHQCHRYPLELSCITGRWREKA